MLNLTILGLHISFVLTLAIAQGGAVPPACQAEPGRNAEQINGQVSDGSTFGASTPSGWIVRLVPVELGWRLQISAQGREMDDLSGLTPPWQFSNPRTILGWHFRNANNTAPNDGSINAPQELRTFIFSPDVGREIPYDRSSMTAENVEKVRSFGRGWLFIESYSLTAPDMGRSAAMESMHFRVCLTWPAT